MRKATWIALLIPSVILTGLLGGMLIGARFVAADAGLAGGAIVLFYGILGTLVAAMLIAVLARRLSAYSMKNVSLLALAICIAVIAVTAWQFIARKQQMEERSRIASPKT